MSSSNISHLRYGNPASNSTNSSFSDAGWLDNPLDSVPVLQYFFVVCLALQSFIGSIGNVLVVGAVCVIPALRTTGNYFIVNLSLADLLVTSVTQPSNIIGALFGEKWFNNRPVLCSVVATLCATGCISSTWNICMIAINRYVQICHFELYDKVYTRKNTVMMCLGIWLIIYGIELPNHFGWGDNRFSVVFFVCTFANHVHSYAVFYICTGVMIPVIGSFAAYYAIFHKVKKSSLIRSRILYSYSKSRAAGHRNRHSRNMSRRLFYQNVRVARSLFRVYLIFIIMWIPVAVVILLGKGREIHHVWYILTILLAHGNSSINCFVYAASLEHFRDGYYAVLHLFFTKTHFHSHFSFYTFLTRLRSSSTFQETATFKDIELSEHVLG